MDNSKIIALNEKRKALHVDYNKVVVEYTNIKEQYIDALSKIGDQIHAVDAEIRRLRTPVEE
jgi:SMC interacting uncharacterized protein involved in chromosome segregation